MRRIMLSVFLLLCAIHRPFDVVPYSLTPSNRENWEWLSRGKFTVSVESSIAVQLSDNISEIWSSIILFRGEIAIIQGLDCRIPGPLNVFLKKLPLQSRSPQWHGRENDIHINNSVAKPTTSMPQPKDINVDSFLYNFVSTNFNK